MVNFVSVFIFGVADENGVGSVDENHGKVTQRTPDDETDDSWSDASFMENGNQTVRFDLSGLDDSIQYYIHV